MKLGIVNTLFHPSASSFILALSRIPSDLNVRTVLVDLDIFKTERVCHSFHAGAADGAKRFTSSDDHGSGKERDLVNQAGIDESSGDTPASFNQHALN